MSEGCGPTVEMKTDACRYVSYDSSDQIVGASGRIIIRRIKGPPRPRMNSLI